MVDQGEVYNFHFSWCDLLFASRTSHIFFCTKDSGTASTLFCWVNLAPHFSHGLISMPCESESESGLNDKYFLKSIKTDIGGIL